VRYAVAAVALALSLPWLAPDRADAAFVVTQGATLFFVGGIDPADQPDLARDVTFTQSGGSSMVIESAGDPIATDEVRCVHADPGAPDSVTCDLSGIDDLGSLTANGSDRVAVDSSLPATLCGGPGNDTLSGGSGADLIAGAEGGDELSGGGGPDILRADHVGAGPDSVGPCSADEAAPPGVNTLRGGPGDDLLVGDDGTDALTGETGDDVAFGRSGDDRVSGGDGDDLLVGLDGADTLDGGPGSDVLSGGLGPDRLDGGDGDDDLGLPILLTVDRGGPVETSVELGNDQLDGGAADDTLFAGAGDRTVTYGLDAPQRAGGRREANGADVLSGGAGTDLVSYVNREIPVRVSLDGRADDGSAGEGDDVGADVERVTGGTADDVLDGGPGSDVLDGGPGSDMLRGLEGADALMGGDVDGAADALSGGPGPDALNGGPGPDRLQGDDGDDGLRGGGDADRLDGGAGDDDLRGEGDADDLAGGPGADVLDGGPGADRVDYADATSPVTVTLDDVRNDGQLGEDWVRQAENVRGGPGADTLFGNTGANAIEGGPGADVIDPAAGTDRVSAGPGRDAILARDHERDAVACGAGRDVAIADELDAIAGGIERCERADLGARARRGEALLRPVCPLAVRLRGGARAFPVGQAISVPRGTLIDALRCAATISRSRRAPRARVSGGAFVLRRAGTPRRALALALAGGTPGQCRGAPSRLVRTLTVRARGAVRLVARYARSTGRSARWTVDDRCGRTLTRVRRGAVRVAERGRRRHVVVQAPRVHVSKPRSGGR
jgi:Ca2+-binding RTX toxin-like protein